MTISTNSIDSAAAWRADYENRLKQDWGWLTVTGLYWIDDGVHLVGSSDEAAIRLERGHPSGGSDVPRRVANITREGQRVSIEVLVPGQLLQGGQAAESGVLRFDGTQGERFIVGHQSFQVVQRGERVGVRTWNNDSRQRQEYTGSDWFEPDGQFSVEARFMAFPEPREIHYQNVIGDSKVATVPGEWSFTLQGRELSLIAFPGQNDSLFFVFRDATSGTETYGASRFLSAPAPVDGHTTLDFNRAYNPPCAFTPHATCPLPPKENVLDVRIEAGERTYVWS